jgi:hypothetical protein
MSLPCARARRLQMTLGTGAMRYVSTTSKGIQFPNRAQDKMTDRMPKAKKKARIKMMTMPWGALPEDGMDDESALFVVFRKAKVKFATLSYLSEKNLTSGLFHFFLKRNSQWSQRVGTSLSNVEQSI